MVSEKLIPLGFVIILIGIIIIIFGTIFNISNKSTVKGGFVGFIGPFPFGFASDKNTLYLILVIAAIFLILFLIFRRFV